MAYNKIDSINGYLAADFERYEAAPILRQFDGEQIRISIGGNPTLDSINTHSPVIKGQSKLIYKKGNEYLGVLAKQIMGSLERGGLYILGLLLDERRQDIEIHNTEGLMSMLDFKQSVNAEVGIKLMIDHANVYVSEGTDVAVVINNADTLSEQSISEILAAPHITHKGSLTAVLVCSTAGITDKVNRLIRICDSSFEL